MKHYISEPTNCRIETIETFDTIETIETFDTFDFDTSVTFIKTSGGCMRPLIKIGEVVCIVKKKGYRLGDVVLYEINGQKFLHRIIKILPKDEYIVCDDMGITSPMKISYKNVLGYYPTFLSGLLGWIYHIFLKIAIVLKRKFFKIFLY
jgi:hypothetical protein